MIAGVRRAGGPRLRPLAAIGVTAALVAALLTAGTPASAEPDSATARAQARALATQVSDLEARTEVVTERYNAVSAKLALVVTASITASARLDALRGMDTSAQDAATRRISAIYRSGGGLALYASVLDGTSPTDVLNRLHTVQSLVGDDRTQITDLQRAVTDATATKAKLLQLSRERTRLEKSAQDSRDEVQRLLTTKRDALANANATIVRLAAEEQQRRQAAAEAAARTALVGAGAIIGNAAPGNPYAVGAIAAAQSRLGVPYVWGATGPDTFDCSGLIQWAYRQAGLSLARVAADQYRSGPEVALSALAPGDLVFWATDPSRKSTIHHVAMYVGNGRMIEAPHSGALVRLVPLRLGPEFAGAVRPGLGSLPARTA